MSYTECFVNKIHNSLQLSDNIIFFLSNTYWDFRKTNLCLGPATAWSSMKGRAATTQTSPTTSRSLQYSGI